MTKQKNYNGKERTVFQQFIFEILHPLKAREEEMKRRDDVMTKCHNNPNMRDFYLEQWNWQDRRGMRS